MKQGHFIAISFFVFTAIIGIGCKTTGYGSALKNENTDIVVKEKPDVLSYTSIRRQQIPSFSDRATASRGLFGPLLGGAVSLATNAVKKMIAKGRAKYVANYSFALTDLYFYDQVGSGASSRLNVCAAFSTCS